MSKDSSYVWQPDGEKNINSDAAIEHRVKIFTNSKCDTNIILKILYDVFVERVTNINLSKYEDRLPGSPKASVLVNCIAGLKLLFADNYKDNNWGVVKNEKGESLGIFIPEERLGSVEDKRYFIKVSINIGKETEFIKVIDLHRQALKNANAYNELSSCMAILIKTSGGR
jgi:hypothetical protein